MEPNDAHTVSQGVGSNSQMMQHVLTNYGHSFTALLGCCLCIQKNKSLYEKIKSCIAENFMQESRILTLD
jgi:hypothetical protein